MSSLKNIAEHAGVSKTTVSFVLNGRGDEKNISAETQKKVLDTAKLLNYQPNHLARSLSMGRSYTIGFVVPDISNPFFGKIARLVERFAEEKKYSVMVASTDENPLKEQKIIESFRNRQIDGIIIAPSSNVLDKMPSGNFPMVVFDRVYSNQSNSFVDINNKESASKLTRQLIDKGNRRIGLISLTSYLPNIYQRIEGYKNALADNAITIDETVIKELDGKPNKENVKGMMDQLLSGEDPVTAILFLNNVCAAEGIWTVNRHYPYLLDQLQFACFDNLDVFDYALPKVTSALQPSEDIARSCVRMLFQQIESKKASKGQRFSTEIIER